MRICAACVSPVHGYDLDDDGNAAIVLSVIEIAHRLSLKVTAEGGEDQNALDQPKLLNYDTAQSYFAGSMSSGAIDSASVSPLTRCWLS